MTNPTPAPDPIPSTPTGIIRDGEMAIRIDWDDHSSTRWTAEQLRRACPCATCREKRRGSDAMPASPSGRLVLPVLSAAEAKPLRIEAMRPVGSYAYNVTFSDGHSSGIFQFALLHRGPEAGNEGAGSSQA